MQALLLAVVLGVAISLSFGQANAMSAHMAVAAAMTDAGSDPCHGCDAAEDAGADAMSCLSVCAAAAQGVLPGEPADLPWASRATFRVAHVLGDGRVSSPAHGPPKLPTLG